MKKKSSKVEVAKLMPELYHTQPGFDFDIEESDAVSWLVSQPEILEYVWNNVKHNLVYNPLTKKWSGIDYES